MVFQWAVRVHSLLRGTACYKLYMVEIMMCSWHPWIYSTPFPRAPTFFSAAGVASNSPKYELGKVAFGSMFLKRKKSQRLGASSFSKIHHMRPHAKKIPLPPLGRTYNEPKNHFAIGRNSERCSYNTDLSRFVLPISNPSALNFSKFVGFQDSPNLSKIEKVAETCEFDGKEPLFV